MAADLGCAVTDLMRTPSLRERLHRSKTVDGTSMPETLGPPPSPPPPMMAPPWPTAPMR
mgnify:CR=1 FL=1